MKGSPEWSSWSGMKSRCSDPKARQFKNYGARGIRVSEEWNKSFERFLADMGPSPGEGYSIDRIDNNGDYCKGNCRWATKKQQASNTRVNHVIEFNGQSKTLMQWAEILGLRYGTIRMRIADGWSAERALTTPIRQYINRA
jgi:hypothetical protein